MFKRLIVRQLGIQPYLPIWEAMQAFTNQRDKKTLDEIWFLEHPPVYTLGQTKNSAHILDSSDIPVIPIDRGGQVTYHGPGQLIAYTLIDLRRKNLTVRQLVNGLESALIETLSSMKIQARTKQSAPGVYVDEKKIASIGLRVRRGCSFHGLALNINMNLQPFKGINPCGYANLEMTQVNDFDIIQTCASVEPLLLKNLMDCFGYSQILRNNTYDNINTEQKTTCS